MTAQELLMSFDSLDSDDQQAVAAEILRRSIGFQLPELSEQDLVLAAEEVFLEYDRAEALDEESATR